MAYKIRTPEQKEHRRVTNRIAYKALRIEMLNAYGAKCACCGETASQFLTLEHKNNDGAAHRRAKSRDLNALRKELKKKGWPKDAYTILCYNCNCARGFYGFCHVVH